MPHYDLEFQGTHPGDVDSLSFEARSLGGALDLAKKKARGDWADLYEDGRPICHLELVAKSGVWLVGGHDAATGEPLSDRPGRNG